MVRGSILVLLAALAVGCASYRSRGQGPFADRPRKGTTPPAALPPVNPPQPAAPVANPTPPPPPADRAEAAPVPPRPPEPMTTTIAPPATPRPPAVEPAPRSASPSPVSVAQQPPAVEPAPQPASPQANPGALTKLADTATKRWAGIDSFEAKLTRREVVRGEAAQTEEVLLQLRSQPYAVYMRNTGEVGRGREVLYNPSRHEDKVHAIVGEGDSRLYKAGLKAPSLSPDSPLVKNKSRRSIRDAGPGTAVALFARLVQASPADLKYVGPVRRPEFGDLPLELVEQTVRPRAEPDAERGGVRSWYFDAKPDSPSFGLPVLMTLVESGSIPPKELEFYCYTQVKAPAGLTDADFNVERLNRPRR
ncbi:DUF1571 domain-containing protein [Urbifossiella limnaea]|uniref:DUF1571 domain-containing protein n=1 Tax=Urbifossiella limnaea TaxID=2528023 RepID=A0A517XKW4_9BACT|nr:DUF1571 domain-containing protein [Urbifossiella limnaea]QDU18151.1 hypothetical protein ETAA1_00340 [Urbifossiella limnaea]